jgi:hypothetical protein
MIWVGSVLGAMGRREEDPTTRRTTCCASRSRLRNFGDLFNPSRAGISEAVVPPTSRFIGKTQADLQLRKRHGISLLAINRDKRDLARGHPHMAIKRRRHAGVPQHLADLAQASEGKDFVVVTDYPKERAAPAQAVGRDGDLRHRSSRWRCRPNLPVPVALMTGAVGMLVWAC